MRHLLRILPLLALAALMACQDGVTPPKVLSFTADPTTVRAGESSTLRWTVLGSGTITIDPGVGDVSGTNQTTVTPSVTTTYSLTASNAAGSDGEQVTVTVETGVTVAGVVLGMDGRPAPGAEVVVLGEGSATAGADGSFTLNGIEVPYTIHVLHPTEPLAVTYVGLSATDPVLLLSGTPTAPAHTASIYGMVSAGTGFPQPAQHVTAVALASEATRGSVQADGATGAYQMVGLPWYGADTEGALHALQWKVDGAGLPLTFVGHGERAISLHGTTLGYLAQDMALLPVGESSVTGTVDLPSGYALGARTASVMFPEGGWITIANELFPGAAFSYVTPTVADAGITVVALAGAPGGELVIAARTPLPTTAAGVTLTVPSVPQLDAPADGATGVGYATDFSWTAPSGGVAVVTFNTVGGGPAYAVVTDATHVTLPDLSERGLGVPAGATLRWQVTGLAAYANVDAAVANDDGFLSSWWLNAFLLPKRDGAFAPSLQRQVTVAP